MSTAPWSGGTAIRVSVPHRETPAVPELDQTREARSSELVDHACIGKGSSTVREVVGGASFHGKDDTSGQRLYSGAGSAWADVATTSRPHETGRRRETVRSGETRERIRGKGKRYESPILRGAPRPPGTFTRQWSRPAEALAPGPVVRAEVEMVSGVVAGFRVFLSVRPAFRAAV